MTETTPTGVEVRTMRPEEARLFLEVHHAAVRGLAAGAYPPDVVEAWAPLPVTAEAVAGFLANRDREVRLVASLAGAVVGAGAFVPGTAELRACYVAPAAARRGVGSALVRAIERFAADGGLAFLELDSSVNAEPFYAALGYEVRWRGEHVLRSGLRMACARMRSRRLVPG